MREIEIHAEGHQKSFQIGTRPSSIVVLVWPAVHPRRFTLRRAGEIGGGFGPGARS